MTVSFFFSATHSALAIATAPEYGLNDDLATAPEYGLNDDLAGVGSNFEQDLLVVVAPARRGYALAAICGFVRAGLPPYPEAPRGL